MSTKYNTILWDLDGTLLDFKVSEKYALTVCMKDFGVELTENLLKSYSEINENYWKRLEKGEVTKAELLPGRFRDFFAKEGISHIDPKAIQEKYQVELGTTTCFCDDSFQIVKQLKEKGIKQYLVTNGVIITQQLKMKNSGFDQLMDGVFISDEIGFEKPHVKFFEAVFQTLPELNKGKTILIGDSISSDMKGAYNVGLDSCFYNPGQSALQMEVPVTYEIHDLHEVFTIIGE